MRQFQKSTEKVHGNLDFYPLGCVSSDDLWHFQDNQAQRKGVGDEWDSWQMRPRRTKTHTSWAFPGGPVVKTSPSNAEGVGWSPGQGVKIPHGSRPETQNLKQK